MSKSKFLSLDLRSLEAGEYPEIDPEENIVARAFQHAYLRDKETSASLAENAAYFLEGMIAALELLAGTHEGVPGSYGMEHIFHSIEAAEELAFYQDHEGQATWE